MASAEEVQTRGQHLANTMGLFRKNYLEVIRKARKSILVFDGANLIKNASPHLHLICLCA